MNKQAGHLHVSTDEGQIEITQDTWDSHGNPASDKIAIHPDQVEMLKRWLDEAKESLSPVNEFGFS